MYISHFSDGLERNAHFRPVQHLEMLLQYDNDVSVAYLATPTTQHIYQLFEDEQFCGYANAVLF